MEGIDYLRRQYVEFCYSPLRSDGQIEDDFEHLINHPETTNMSFVRTDVLAIGTKPVVIVHEENSYNIGEFIILLHRYREGKTWGTEFSFLNPTRTIRSESDDRPKEILHPHIYGQYDLYLDCVLGTLCIEHGQTEVYTAIREGRLLAAFKLLHNILGIYQAEGAYVQIEHSWAEQYWENDND